MARPLRAATERVAGAEPRWDHVGVRARVAAAAVVLILLGAPPGEACDSTACLSATRGLRGSLRQGGLRLDLSYRFADQTDRLAGAGSTSTVLRPYVEVDTGRLYPGWHEDESARERFLQADVEYGFTDRLSAWAALPVLADRSSVGTDEVCRYGYGARGIGDLALGLRHRHAVRGGSLVLSGGVEFPTGDSRRRYSLDTAVLEPMVQPGTGSTDVLLAASYSRLALGLDWTASASVQHNTTNGYEYRFGREHIIAVSAGSRIRGRLSASLQVKGAERLRSVFAGQPVPSTGNRAVWLNPGLRFDGPAGTSLYGILQVAAWRHVNEQQLATRTGFLTGLSWTRR
jgi:hypothetical protein